jgi:putative transposase
VIVDFIDSHRSIAGVESIGSELQVAPSTYYRYKAERRDPERRSARKIWDEYLCTEIKRVWGENYEVYGARKVWKQLNREGILNRLLYCGTIDEENGPSGGRAWGNHPNHHVC